MQSSFRVICDEGILARNKTTTVSQVLRLAGCRDAHLTAPRNSFDVLLQVLLVWVLILDSLQEAPPNEVNRIARVVVVRARICPRLVFTQLRVSELERCC